jgi:hypothetical protein
MASSLVASSDREVVLVGGSSASIWMLVSPSGRPVDRAYSFGGLHLLGSAILRSCPTPTSERDLRAPGGRSRIPPTLISTAAT